VGRLYAAWTHHLQGETGISLFDEVALGNDLQAACAGALAQPSASGLSPEERLERIKELRQKGAITDREYEEKRAEVIKAL
jgi:hypothetical protein